MQSVFELKGKYAGHTVVLLRFEAFSRVSDGGMLHAGVKFRLQHSLGRGPFRWIQTVDPDPSDEYERCERNVSFVDGLLPLKPYRWRDQQKGLLVCEQNDSLPFYWTNDESQQEGPVIIDHPHGPLPQGKSYDWAATTSLVKLNPNYSMERIVSLRWGYRRTWTTDSPQVLMASPRLATWAQIFDHFVAVRRSFPMFRFVAE